MPPAAETFLQAPLAGVRSRALRALWHAAHDDWHAAHEEAQAGEDEDCAWVHAMLHRQEGDRFNAAYWYRRAGKPVFQGTLPQEQEAMILSLLQTAS